MKKVVQFEKNREAGLAILRIDRPEASNAVNTQVMEELADALDCAREDADVRVVILTGTGERSFVAGGDLKEFHSALTSEEIVYEKMSQMRRVLEQIVSFPKPVIAAVNGAARGGGGEVAAACHFRVASETATVGYVQVKLGVSPGWGGGVLLERIVGRQKAMWLTLSGEVFGAEKGKEIGFFEEVLPAENFLDHAQTFAKKLAANPTPSLQALLHRFQGEDHTALFAEMEKESRLCAQLWMTPEHMETVSAFLNRNKG
ncbi:MAG: enoyl-CoA hydratase/isomerase family protein [Tumebacillaceae bacterium]